MNARTVMSSKGQIVVPKSVRDAHGWGEGTEFEITDAGGTMTLKAVDAPDPRFPPVDWDDFVAMRPKIDRFPTDEEIERTLLAEAGRRFDANRR